MPSKSSRSRAGQDRRNEAGWYRPLTMVIAIIALAIGTYRFAKPALFGVDMRIEAALTGILVSHEKALTIPAEDLMILYNSVTSVEALPSRPQLKKMNGLDGLKTLIGKFQGEGLGEVQVYARNYRDPATKFVKLTTTTTTYILTPADAVAFVGIVQSQIKK
ncbi:MAG: PH domain-containing protein [Bacillota bacterium]